MSSHSVDAAALWPATVLRPPAAVPVNPVKETMEKLPSADAKQATISSEQAQALELKHALAHIHQRVQALAPELEFSIDQEAERTIVKVIDRHTKALIRQIPSEEVLHLAKALDQAQGLLIRLRG